jgi:hypothetical protein
MISGMEENSKSVLNFFQMFADLSFQLKIYLIQMVKNIRQVSQTMNTVLSFIGLQLWVFLFSRKYEI